jgi:diguanylate cyclase (GGDEF)-like protein
MMAERNESQYLEPASGPPAIGHDGIQLALRGTTELEVTADCSAGRLPSADDVVTQDIAREVEAQRNINVFSDYIDADAWGTCADRLKREFNLDSLEEALAFSKSVEARQELGYDERLILQDLIIEMQGLMLKKERGLREKQVVRLEAAGFDSVTCLKNRGMLVRYMHAAYGVNMFGEFPGGSELRRENERPANLLIIFIDICELKYINDKIAYSYGDKYLHDTASAIKACVRASDMVARIGGDEFMVVMPLPSHFTAEQIREIREVKLKKFREALSRPRPDYVEELAKSGKAIDPVMSVGAAGGRIASPDYLAAHPNEVDGLVEVDLLVEEAERQMKAHKKSMYGDSGYKLHARVL